MATKNSINSSYPVEVAAGGTGATTLTSNSLILGNGTSAISALGTATNGQIPIGNTGNAPTLAAITAGTNISVTNGAGSITIANTIVNGSLVYISTSTATSTTTPLTITSGISATYNTYFLMITNYTSSINDTLEMRVSNNGGSSYDATGYETGIYVGNYNAAPGANINNTLNVSIINNQQGGEPYGSAYLWCYNMTNGQQSSFVGQNASNNNGTAKIGMIMASGPSDTVTINALEFRPGNGGTYSLKVSLYGLLE